MDHTNLGAEARFFWGQQELAHHLFKPHTGRTLRVGEAGADFTLHEPRLLARPLELLRVDGERFWVQVPRGLEDSELKFCRAGQPISPDALAQRKEWTLEPDDTLDVTLGGIRVRLARRALAAEVKTPWQDSVNLLAFNSFITVFFLMALFIIEAQRRQSEAVWVDELSQGSRPVISLMQDAQRAHVERTVTAVAAPAPIASPHPRSTNDRMRRRVAVAHPLTARDSIHRLFSQVGSAQALFGEGNTGLQDALRNLRGDGRSSGALGFMGLVPRGQGPGAGAMDGSSAGIGVFGSLRTLPPGKTIIDLHKQLDVIPAVSDPDVQIHGIDPELIRRVIHSHRDQLRYCYEVELTRTPSLSGKVKVAFMIGSVGTVITSAVVESSAHNARLEECITQRVRTWIFAVPPKVEWRK